MHMRKPLTLCTTEVGEERDKADSQQPGDAAISGGCQMKMYVRRILVAFKVWPRARTETGVSSAFSLNGAFRTGHCSVSS